MSTDFNETIIDSSKPNAGRIYDYFLGGQNHFEVDRQMAEQIKEKAPFAPQLAVMTRWFLTFGIKKALKQGFTQFLDYASGLPAVDHIHIIAPEGTKIIYSDIDPITVKYANKIIGENSFVKYKSCNAAEPEKLLKSDIIKIMFGDNHKCVIGYNGILWFLNNKQISHAMKVLYEWAAEGSILYLTDYDSDTESQTDESKDLWTVYRNMNMLGEARTKKELIELVKPWEVIEPGFLSIEKWRGIEEKMKEKSKKTWGGGGIFGGFLKK